MNPIRVRPLRPTDYAWALALNNNEVPNVNALDSNSFAEIADMAACTPVAEIDGAPAGFMIAFLPGAAYGSANYRWFAERYPSFLYVDRVIADPALRGRGVGKALYAHAMDFGRDRAGLLTCEVNEAPPNPASMRFHEALGFRPLGRQTTEGGEKNVVMLGLDLAGEDPGA
jgi:hypothetical protein